MLIITFNFLKTRLTRSQGSHVKLFSEQNVDLVDTVPFPCPFCDCSAEVMNIVVCVKPVIAVYLKLKVVFMTSVLTLSAISQHVLHIILKVTYIEVVTKVN